jgi:carbon monoxide dehydrogenase subunit G
MPPRIPLRPAVSLVAWSRALLAAAGFAAGIAAAQSPIKSLDVQYDGETYVATVVMFAPVGQAVAWEVLTDFDHMANWIPNVKESAIVKRDDRAMTIEQRGIAKFGGLSFPYTTVREIVATPQTTIKSTQVKGSMKKLQSMMTLAPEADGTRMQYRLEMVPNLIAGSVLSKDFVRGEIEDQFTAIVGEMQKRKR